MFLQGKQFNDHFGFISVDNRARKEGKKEQYVMYIFQVTIMPHNSLVSINRLSGLEVPF